MGQNFLKSYLEPASLDELICNKIECFFSGTGDNGLIADLDDGAVEQIGVCGNRGDNVVLRRLLTEAEGLELRFFRT